MYEKLEFRYARESLKYLIKLINIKKLYLPYYLCDVIRHSVIATGCKPMFYHINDKFFPAIEFDKSDYILYPNYFGVCEDNVNKLEKLYPKLIVDNAHAYYLPPQGLACFNSKRKFLQVPYGSELYVKKEAELLVADTICNCGKRIEKFKYYNDVYGEANLLKFDKTPKSPFCYPFLAKTEEEANIIANKLIEEGKIIYRYWNNLPQSYNEYKFYSRMVPIPLV